MAHLLFFLKEVVGLNKERERLENLGGIADMPRIQM